MKSKILPTVLIGVTVDRSVAFHSELAALLGESGWDVHIVSSRGPVPSNISADVQFHELEMRRNPQPVLDILSLMRWFMLLKKIHPTVVLVGTPKASLLGLLTSAALRVPVRIYFVHGIRYQTTRGLKRMLLRSLEKLSVKCATSVVSVSKSVRSELVADKIVPEDKVVVIGSGSAKGVDLNRFAPISTNEERTRLKESLQIDPNVQVVGFIGRLTVEKGIGELREAVVELFSEGTQFQLVLLGEAEDALGQSLVDSLRGFGITVIAPGRVKNPEDYLRIMDVLCLPSYREGLGTVILEAFASKVPVIATDVTGVVDLIEDGNRGLLVPPRNSTLLKYALERMLSDSELAANLASSAYEFVEQNFSNKKVINMQRDFLLQKIRNLNIDATTKDIYTTGDAQ